MKSFFVEKCTGEDFVLTASEHNHLANVLRCNVDDEVTVFCGDKYNYLYRVKQIRRNETLLAFIKKTKNTCNPTRRLTVFLAVIKADNIALVVQKLSELGATDLVLFNASRCNVSPLLVNISRLKTIAQQSCKQCGRSVPLNVHGILSFQQLLKQLESYKAFFADESTQDLPHLHFFSFSTIDNAALVIGPEGGFTKLERDQLRPRTIPVTMGKRILRAETAVIAGTAIMLAHMGEI